MKQVLGWGTGLSVAAVVLMAQAPAIAFTVIRDVQIVDSNGETNLVLVTEGGGRPEVFVVRRGNDFVADVINTQLNMGQEMFQKNNPAPGIASIVVTQLDPTSVRVIVTGASSPPDARVVQGASGGIVISMLSGGTSAANVPPNSSSPPTSTPSPDVLVPEPQVEIDRGSLAQQPTPPRTTPAPSQQQPIIPDPATRNRDPQLSPGLPRTVDPTPPFLPRAVAPPVGDIAVSNVNPAVQAVNLNTTEVIPRLVLRDALVRDVLSLLARTAGLNVAFASDFGNTTGQGGAQGGTEALTISLDIENESVQDVFNYVLRLSGLEANRQGNTIFVGRQLPNTARDVVVRSFRLNQIPAGQAAAFLVSMGAERAITREQQVTRANSVNIPGSTQALTTTDTQVTTVVETLRVETQDSIPLLRGLQVIVDDRLNSLTLIGQPNLVEVASAQLIQLDLRKRQVAINVKVLDINLDGEDTFDSSFSFGIDQTFFVNDGGAAALNFGSYNPPNLNQSTSGINARPIVPNNPVGNQEPFFDRDGTTTTPLTAPGRGGVTLRPVSPVTDRSERVGISDFDPFDRNDDGTFDAGEVEFSTFPLFQYPRRFLQTLQFQIQNRNAKILTDPTLLVQEGEIARVELVENIVKRFETDTIETDGGQRTETQPEFEDVGLEVSINVERVDDNGFVTINVNPVVTAITNRIPLGGVANGDFATETSRREYQSGRIRLRDGQTLIVSGIIQEQDRVIASKIPFLGDLPILGALFRSSTRETGRAEVVVLVTPMIMDESDRAPFGYEYNVSPDAREMLQRSR
ncbi:bacterial type II and III secretion system family protein [Lyngbya aestuarii BL J]|uniref:Bacterial type II and III secretion system family protein n=1 Tax=Lyngbya aestuarii BL J TaxID=1348334 RepID=U7QGI6_9CYAN|nr:type IV pilus secretin family protein [Lyngbya aestuarii]ERT06998.1 bacterial type II and III secretion system family protein [Lyngbya aestuarii BL J]